MRKLTAILGAILLALVLAGGFITLKNKVAWEELPGVSRIIDRWSSDEPQPPPSVVVEEEAPSSNLTYEEYLKKGDYYFDNGFYTLASNQYVRASKLEPQRTEPYLRLIRADLELGAYDRVKTNSEVVLNLNPNDKEVRFLLALTLVKQSEFDQARGAFAAFTPQETDEKIRYYRVLLGILQESKSGEKPLRELRNQAAGDDLQKKIDAYLAGYSEWSVAQAAEPVYLDELMARAMNQTGEYEMAIQKLKGILKERLDLRDAWIMLGFAYLNLEKYTFALTAFQKAYELDSEWPTTQYFLATTFRELGKFDDAALYFKNAIDNGFEPQIMIKRELADLYFKNQQYQEAVELYKEVITLNQQDVNAFVRPVWLYIDFLQDPKEANKLAKLAEQLFPNNALSLNLLGWSEGALGDRAAAETHLKQALALDPKLAAAAYNLGKVYEAEERFAEAIQMYQQAYQNEPQGSIGQLAAQRYNALLQN